MPRILSLRCLLLTFFLEKINKSIINNYYDKSNEFKEFTPAEAVKIFGNDKSIIKNFRIKFSEPIDFELLSILYAIHHKTTTLEVIKKWNVLLPNSNKKAKNVERNFYFEKSGEIKSTLTDVMNDIEYFSMYFCSGLAIPDNVYMSLHQTFIRFIINSYLYICMMNNDSVGHEYYAHTIALFSKWQHQSLEQDKERERKLADINKINSPKKMH